MRVYEIDTKIMMLYKEDLYDINNAEIADSLEYFKIDNDDKRETPVIMYKKILPSKKNSEILEGNYIVLKCKYW